MTIHRFRSSGALRSSRELARNLGSSQELSGQLPGRSQELWGALRSCQELSGAPMSSQESDMNISKKTKNHSIPPVPMESWWVTVALARCLQILLGGWQGPPRRGYLAQNYRPGQGLSFPA